MVISEQWSDCEMIRQPFPTYRQLHLIRPIKFYISIDEFIIIITVWSGEAKITGGGANIRGAGAQLRWAPPYFHYWVYRVFTHVSWNNFVQIADITLLFSDFNHLFEILSSSHTLPTNCCLFYLNLWEWLYRPVQAGVNSDSANWSSHSHAEEQNGVDYTCLSIVLGVYVETLSHSLWQLPYRITISNPS